MKISHFSSYRTNKCFEIQEPLTLGWQCPVRMPRCSSKGFIHPVFFSFHSSQLLLPTEPHATVLPHTHPVLSPPSPRSHVPPGAGGGGCLWKDRLVPIIHCFRHGYVTQFWPIRQKDNCVDGHLRRFFMLIKKKKKKDIMKRQPVFPHFWSQYLEHLQTGPPEGSWPKAKRWPIKMQEQIDQSNQDNAGPRGR